MHDILTSFRPNSGLTCIHIQGDGIAVVRIARRKNDAPPVISECLLRPLDKQQDLDKTLKSLSKELGLKNSRCTTLLAEQNYKLLMTDRPKVPDTELAAALSWQIKDLIDQPVDETTFEVFPAPPAADITAAESSYVVAAENDAIQRSVAPLANANINLHCIDIQEMALRNLTMLMPETEQGKVLLWLNKNNGILIIARDGEIYLSRSISIGIDDLSDESNQDRNIDALILEIQRSLDYYETRYQTNPITSILLAPGISTRIPALATLIQQTLAIDARPFELDQYIEYSTEMPENWQRDFFIPIGAALRTEGIAA